MFKIISSTISFIILVFWVVFISPLAFGETNRAESLEWLTVDSDLIVRGVVTEVKKTMVHIEEFPNLPMEEVVVQINEVLKGSYHNPSISFIRFNYWNPTEESAEQWKEAKSEFLFFLSQGKLSPHMEPVHVDLTKQWVIRSDYPDGPIDLTNPKRFAYQIVSEDMTSPDNGERILQIVRNQLHHTKKITNQFAEVKNFSQIPQGAKILEAPEDSEAYKNLYGGSSVEVIVPEN